MKLESLLESVGMKLTFSSHLFRKAEPLLEYSVDWAGTAQDTILSSCEEGTWQISVESKELYSQHKHPNNHSHNAIDFEVEWRHSGYSSETSVEVRLEIAQWKPSTYVLIPGAVYGGNRFESRKLSYPPCWSKLSERGPHTPALITDVPRLSTSNQGPSAIQLLAGDAATPAIGLYDSERKQGVLILTQQRTEFGDTSMHVEEMADRKSAVVAFRAPGVRSGTKYDMCTTEIPSPDRGADFRDGDRVSIPFQLFVFPCNSVSDLFRVLAEVRQSMTGIPELPNHLPFSAAWEIQEAKFNQLNWKEDYGYYAVGTVDMKHQDWQLGWVGGGMSSYALLLEGSNESLSRALRTIDFIFSGQTTAGFFPGVFYSGNWYGDEFSDAANRDAPEQWHIVRKSADALYFLVKHFIALNKSQPDAPLPLHWLAGTRRLADGFLRLWSSYGQFGQWIHAETGEMLVGGSAGGAMAIGGLALYGWYTKEQTYLTAACEAGEYYYRMFTQKGITTGGPGEILQCPDSESAFALLESYVVLFETTGEQKWLLRAEEAAQQAISWCVSYNFVFPEHSTFGRLGLQTVGSVIANVQNKHSAPGICTLSGDSLFKLFRATGNQLYLHQLRETTHQLPQYLSRRDRPIRGWDGEDLLPGYMSERVNMSDWEGTELVGEALPLSCWCEVSNMLAYVEVPGIYVQPDTGLLWIFDHVECSISEEQGRKWLTITNPTSFPASVKILAEMSTEVVNPLGQCALSDLPRIRVGPGEVHKIPLIS